MPVNSRVASEVSAYEQNKMKPECTLTDRKSTMARLALTGEDSTILLTCIRIRISYNWIWCLESRPLSENVRSNSIPWVTILQTLAPTTMR